MPTSCACRGFSRGTPARTRFSTPPTIEMRQRYAPPSSDLPLVVCANGSVLKNPTEVELARALGMLRIDDPDRTYDVAIVGAGPAGLATAVYAASEGLSVI